MSNLLEQASLVMIPSGYKEDVVYSEIPLDGSGDLSFTRASNGTRINSQGLVEVVPWNLLGYSEQFNNAYWNKRSGVTITADSTTAPNGTLTADTATKTSGDGYIWADLTLLPSTTYTISVYAKGSANIYFNAFWGTGSNTGSPTSLTSDWQRLSFTFTTGSTTSLGDFGFFISATCYIWGAQLNIGSTAKPYFPTTDRLNVPRLTYQNGGGGCPSLLLEKQSTNEALYSNTLETAAWSSVTSGTANTIAINDITSPDGTQNASKITFNTAVTGSGTYSLWRFTKATTANGTYTISVWLKAGTITKTYIRLSDSGGNRANFECNLTSEWQRFTITGATASTITTIAFDIGSDGNGGQTQTSGYLYAWGAQLEASLYATSYIPTTSSSATRVADACYKTGISSLIGSTTGSVFVDFELFTLNGVEGIVEIINLPSTGQRLLIWRNNTELLFYWPPVGNLLSQTIGIGRHKACFTYTPSVFKFFVDGVKIGESTNTSALTGGFNKLDFENSEGGVFIQRKLINECVVSKSAFTEAEAIALTTI